MKKSRILLISFILLICILLSGCWNRREIESLSFVLASGIDQSGDQFQLSTQVVNTEALAKNAPSGIHSYFVFTSKGKTIFDAVRNATQSAPSKLFWSHTKVLVLSEEVAQKGALSALGFFIRDAEERRNFHILVTPGRAETVINADVKTKSLPAMALANTLESNYKSTSQTSIVTLNDFLLEIHGTECPIVPTIKIIKTQKGEQEYQILGSAVFNKDKFISYLSPIETRGVQWVKGKVKSGIIVTPCLDAGKNDKDGKISFEIYQEKSKIDIKKGNNQISIEVHIKERGNLAEGACIKSEINPNTLAKINKLKETAIKEEIQGALKKAYELKTDVFGFGEQIHRKYPKDWKTMKDNWSNKFPSIPVKIIVDSRINGTGLIQVNEGGKK
ncbi:MAG TPA: Ger(x)C family spore germination protein [Bacillota bacterium]|nr:Ger(x)C family spore germination protein [Bacillota bacterium]